MNTPCILKGPFLVATSSDYFVLCEMNELSHIYILFFRGISHNLNYDQLYVCKLNNYFHLLVLCMNELCILLLFHVCDSERYPKV